VEKRKREPSLRLIRKTDKKWKKEKEKRKKGESPRF
jgi:hypothetical protein